MQRLHLLYNNKKQESRHAAAPPIVQLLLLLLLLPLQAGAAQWKERYTKEHPLTVACDWEFQPYEFSNDAGQPDGYNVDVLKAIFEAMKVPYRFQMKESVNATKDFEEDRADLIVAPMRHTTDMSAYGSRNILNYCKPMGAVNTSLQADSAQLLSNGAATIVAKVYDEATKERLRRAMPDVEIATYAVNEAMARVSNQPELCFVWDGNSLRWFVREMNLTNVRVVDLGLPAYEIHIVGHDKQLIDEIDDQYARLEQSGQLRIINDKWFHPERLHNDTSPVAVYVSMAVVLIALVLTLLNRLAKSRALQATRRKQEVEGMMLQALTMSRYSIVEYDGSKGLFFNRHGHLVPDQGVTRQELLSHIHVQDQTAIKALLAQLLSGDKTSDELELRWMPFEEELSGQWQYVRGHVISEKDEWHHVRRILCTVHYVTDEVRQEREIAEMGSRYSKIFETSMIAMSFYSKDGWLIDLNQQMRELCGLTEANERYFRKTNLFDNPYFHDEFDPKSLNQFHVCQHMHYGELGLDKFLELRVTPTTDENGELAYYTTTARDVTDERAINLEQVHRDKELQAVNDKINNYEQQLNYLLVHSYMFIWEADLQTHHISFSRSLSKAEFSVNRNEYVQWMVEDEREAADRYLKEMMMKGQDFNAIHHFTHTASDNQPCWYALSGAAKLDADKQIKGYFGIARNITKLMQAQERLKEESRRADESGKLKSVFLANMTHEIRTPLNAIVGFSDLLQIIDAPEDRREFIRIIRNNCDMLLRLIDDIIEASNMNQGPIAIEVKEVDFAQAFNDICQTLSQRVQEPGVQFIVDNPYPTFVTSIDKGRMQQVITNFTTNAVKYTHKGHIKVGFRYVGEEEVLHTSLSSLHSPLSTLPSPLSTKKGIYMYCEDTGAGIPKEKQAAVFERFVKLNDFVQGTGLGLSICKSIADRCEGHIGVNSEGEGHGSTFWIWIPCEHKLASTENPPGKPQ
ncbi:MAG: transporter substrate-binding domain-containing protein [Prevotella sp.]|nr:transporter substrate-binding domain-containing protein [Prevotella sp.]